MFDLKLQIQTPRIPDLWLSDSSRLVIHSIVKSHSLLLLNRGCAFYWIPHGKSSKTGFEWSRGSWSWFGNPENRTRTSIWAVGHKRTASHRNSGTGSSTRTQHTLTPPDVLARDPPLSMSNALCHSHFPTPVTRRNLEMRCSQSTVHAPLVGCWLLSNNKRRLPTQPSASFEAHGKLVQSQELLPRCWLTARVPKRETPTSRDFLREGTKHM